jgi:hypothetical protein
LLFVLTDRTSNWSLHFVLLFISLYWVNVHILYVLIYKLQSVSDVSNVTCVTERMNKNKLLIVWEIPLHTFDNSGKFNAVTRRHIPKDFNPHHMQSCVFRHEMSNCISFRNERGLCSIMNTWIQFHKNTADSVHSTSGFGCCLFQ